MLTSVEVRWFVEGSLPPDLPDWYEDAAGIPDWQERTDRYIRPAAPGGLNVKWREGQVEVKRRVETLGPSRWGGVSGVVERWRKWGFHLADESPLAATGRDWISVAKHRSVRTLTFREDRLVLTKPGETLQHGCGVELAEITVHHEKWWTICLEAFGPAAEASELLDRTASRVFAENPPPLAPENSMSYVDWLARL
jgi:hypothetical protein